MHILSMYVDIYIHIDVYLCKYRLYVQEEILKVTPSSPLSYPKLNYPTNLEILIKVYLTIYIYIYIYCMDRCIIYIYCFISTYISSILFLFLEKPLFFLAGYPIISYYYTSSYPILSYSIVVL